MVRSALVLAALENHRLENEGTAALWEKEIAEAGGAGSTVRPVSGDRRLGGGRRGVGADSLGSGASMILVPGGVRVWRAGGVTDMGRGMNTSAL